MYGISLRIILARQGSYFLTMVQLLLEASVGPSFAYQSGYQRVTVFPNMSNVCLLL